MVGMTKDALFRLSVLDQTPVAEGATAADAVMADVKALGGTGGVIVAGADGEAVWRFTTPGMYRGRADPNGGREVAIYGDE